MSCYDPSQSGEAVSGECPECGRDVDKDGNTTEDVCHRSPVLCEQCGYQPCDQYC